jgi:hypothetical protein
METAALIISAGRAGLGADAGDPVSGAGTVKELPDVPGL